MRRSQCALKFQASRDFVCLFFFFSPFCADASCQAEIIDFWGDIKSWKSLAGPFGGQRLNSPSSPLWQICISGVGDTLSAVFFPPFLFSFKAFSGNCEKSLATAHAHVCVCDKDKNEKCSLLSALLFFFLGPVSLLLRRWRSCDGFPRFWLFSPSRWYQCCHWRGFGSLGSDLMCSSHGGIDIFSPRVPRNSQISAACVFTTSWRTLDLMPGVFSCLLSDFSNPWLISNLSSGVTPPSLSLQGIFLRGLGFQRCEVTK